MSHLIVKVEGGLGNQLFSYAFGLGISERLNIPVHFDIMEGFLSDKQYQRNLELDLFNFDLPVCSDDFGFRNIYAHGYSLRKKINKFLPLCLRSYIRGHDVSSLEQLLSYHTLRSRVHLEGYFHSERFFKHIEPKIRDGLQLRTVPDAKNLEISRCLRKENSIAVHIRRVKYQYLLPVSWYQRAFQKIEERIPNPIYYCFSDNLDEAKEFFGKERNVILVDHNRSNEKAHLDMWLMSQCQAHIIANSTFSWWGAWWAQSQLVIAPEKWGWDIELPPSWIILPSNNAQ